MSSIADFLVSRSLAGTQRQRSFQMLLIVSLSNRYPRSCFLGDSSRNAWSVGLSLVYVIVDLRASTPTEHSQCVGTTCVEVSSPQINNEQHEYIVPQGSSTSSWVTARRR